MTILLTNDDGILSPGIYAIYKALLKLGKVVVVAPDRERSSISHSITLTHPLWTHHIERHGKPFGVALSGTPADCVKYALQKLLTTKPDLVISGINPGPNDGCSVFYSGTVGGAREGALNGIPAMAISINAFQEVDYAPAVFYGMKVVRYLLKNPLPKGAYLNVNVPHKSVSAIKGLKVTRQGKIPIKGKFSEHINPYGEKYFWMAGIMPKKGKNLNIDTNAVLNNYVTVTPLHSDLTDYALLEELQGQI